MRGAVPHQVTIGDTPVDQEHAPTFPGMYLTKANMAFLGELACCIKQYGAVATYELNHSGWMANPELSGNPPISAVGFTRGDGVKVLQMDEAMMERVADNFASAAMFVKDCGFDGALIHGGHGWLLRSSSLRWSIQERINTAAHRKTGRVSRVW